MQARFSLGIDPGTSNCAMAATDLETDRTEVLSVTQILGANQLGERPRWPLLSTCHIQTNSRPDRS